MYDVDNQREYEEKCIASERTLCASFTLGGHLYDDKYINKISFKHNISASGYGIGAAPAAMLKLELNNFDGELDSAFFQDNDISVSIGVEIKSATAEEEAEFEIVPMGKFIISEVKKSENRIELTAYDKMITLERKADIVLEAPFKMYALLDEVALKGNIDFSGAVLPFGDINIEGDIKWSDYTYRQILEFIAEINCASAFFDKEGRLKIVNMDSYFPIGEAVVDRNSYFEFSCSDEGFAGFDSLIVKFGNGEDDYNNTREESKYTYILSNNPLADFLIDEEDEEHRYGNLDTLARLLGEVQYSCYDIEWRGIPSYEVDDGILFDNSGDSDILRILSMKWEYNGGFKMNCSAPKISGTEHNSDSGRNSIRQQLSDTMNSVEKVTEKVEKIENGSDATFNNTLVEVVKENVVAADMIEASSAFIEDLFVDRLETNLKMIKCIPNIIKTESGYEWSGGSASYTIPTVTNNIRAYIRIEGITMKFIEAHLSASGTRDLKINNRQVYYTSIADGENAYKYFTFTDPKTKYPELTDEEAAMFKVVVRSSESEYEKGEFKFELTNISGTMTYEPKLILGTGDGQGRGKMICEKTADEARIYLNSRTENETKGIAVKDDGLYQIRGSERSKIPFMTVDETEPSGARVGDLWFEPITQGGE